MNLGTSFDVNIISIILGGDVKIPCVSARCDIILATFLLTIPEILGGGHVVVYASSVDNYAYYEGSERDEDEKEHHESQLIFCFVDSLFVVPDLLTVCLIVTLVLFH